MDRHDLDMALREWLLGIFVLVDPTFIQQTQEAMEEVKSERLAVPSGDNGVVVIVLEDAQELRERGEITGAVFILEECDKRLAGYELVEVVSGPESHLARER